MQFELVIGTVIVAVALVVACAVALRARARRLRKERLERWQRYVDAELQYSWHGQVQRWARQFPAEEQTGAIEWLSSKQNSFSVIRTTNYDIDHYLPKHVVKSARRKQLKPLPRLANIVELVADTLLPARVNDEDVGDLIEQRNRLHREGRDRWRVTIWFAAQVAWAFYEAITNRDRKPK